MIYKAPSHIFYSTLRKLSMNGCGFVDILPYPPAWGDSLCEQWWGGVRLVGARAVCIVWVCCAVCVLWVCLRQASCGRVRSVCRVGVGMRVYKEM